MKKIILIISIILNVLSVDAQTVYWPNGQIKTTGNQDNGTFIEYLESGQLEHKYNYKNGIMHGEFINYYKNGQISRKSNYLNGKQAGECIGYFENGKLQYKSNYLNDKLNGEDVEYFENGQLKHKCHFKNGKSNGESIYYYENGQIKYKANYVDDSRNGEYIEYFENGQISRNETYLNLVLTKRIDYWTNGQIRSEAKCKGEDNTETILYYNTGEVEQKSSYVNGKSRGYIGFNKDGTIKNKEGVFAIDKQAGVAEKENLVHPNGAKEITSSVSSNGTQGIAQYREYIKNELYKIGGLTVMFGNSEAEKEFYVMSSYLEAKLNRTLIKQDYDFITSVKNEVIAEQKYINKVDKSIEKVTLVCKWCNKSYLAKNGWVVKDNCDMQSQRYMFGMYGYTNEFCTQQHVAEWLCANKGCKCR